MEWGAENRRAFGASRMDMHLSKGILSTPATDSLARETTRDASLPTLVSLDNTPAY